MVGAQPDLELRLELELALVEVARRHGVAPRQLFEDDRVKRPPARRLGCLHKPRAVQPRQVARGALGRTLSREERLKAHGPRVIGSQHGHEALEEH